MNWTQFSLNLLTLYFLYYMLNICFDLIKSGKRDVTDPTQDELVFSEEHQPKRIQPEQNFAELSTTPNIESNTRQAISSGKIQTTGGVSLKELFSLAQSNLIEYTKAIPY